MTLEELRDKVRKWDRQGTGGTGVATSHFEAILNQLDYHAARDWRVYLPAEYSDFNPSYMERLAAWIGNLTDEADQKLLLEYALYISFFSHDDFAALYSSALNRIITPWIATQIRAKIEPGGVEAFQKIVHEHIHQKTWFCPVTDSMDINEFYKVNHLKGVGHRPGFATLQLLAERAGAPNQGLASNVAYYMEHPANNPQCPALERLVLLEDVVGSGSQCIDAVRWALANLGKPILFVPLILCPKGAEALRLVVQESNNLLTVLPVVELRRNDLLGPERRDKNGWIISQSVEELARRCSDVVGYNYPPFGYNDTGCSLAMFSNTPDNTIPIVHDNAKTGKWNPLFPRVYRDY